VRIGRKWRAAEAVQQAEARLKHNALLGNVAKGRAGLKLKLIDPIRHCQWEGEAEDGPGSVEEQRASRTVAMRQQGAWMKWEQAMERNVTWQDN